VVAEYLGHLGTTEAKDTINVPALRSGDCGRLWSDSCTKEPKTRPSVRGEMEYWTLSGSAFQVTTCDAH
jgi:hypothetical protein